MNIPVLTFKKKLKSDKSGFLWLLYHDNLKTRFNIHDYYHGTTRSYILGSSILGLSKSIDFEHIYKFIFHELQPAKHALVNNYVLYHMDIL
jgi:hypothetical protein